MAIYKTISQFPEAPSRADPENFDERADKFLKHLSNVFPNEINQWTQECNKTQQEINKTQQEVNNTEAQVKILHDDVVNLKTQINSYYQNIQDWYEKITAIATKLSFKGNWYSGATANMGDVYAYNGVLWISLIDGNTATPDVLNNWLPLGGEEFLNASSLIQNMVNGIGWLWNSVNELQSYIEGLLTRIEALEKQVDYLMEKI